MAHAQRSVECLKDGPRLQVLLGRSSDKAASIVSVGLQRCLIELVAEREYAVIA